MNINTKVNSRKVYLKIVALLDKTNKDEHQIEKDCFKAFSIIERMNPHTAKQVLLSMPFNHLPRK